MFIAQQSLGHLVLETVVIYASEHARGLSVDVTESIQLVFAFSVDVLMGAIAGGWHPRQRLNPHRDYNQP